MPGPAWQAIVRIFESFCFCCVTIALSWFLNFVVVAGIMIVMIVGFTLFRDQFYAAIGRKKQEG